MEATRVPPHKMATAELKKALQKIKQTQMEVLLALKNQPAQIQQQHLNDSKVRLSPQANQTNANYMKSISQLNLLKMTEVNNMKKQWQRERQRYADKLSTLQQRMRLLEAELELKTRMETQWNNQKFILEAKIKELTLQKNYNNHTNSDSFIKAEVHSYRQELTQKIKDKLVLENQLVTLQNRLKEVTQQKQIYKAKYERIIKQTLEKEKNKGKSLKNSQQIDKNRVSFDDMAAEVKKALNNHDKIYQSLKTRARIAITDLDVEQQIQQSFNRLLSLIQNCQKNLQEEKKIIQLQDSMIQGLKGFESESFRDQVKRLDRELFESEHFKKEVYELKTEILSLKQKKNEVEFELKKTKELLTTYQKKIKQLQDKKIGSGNQYEALIDELERQMRKIRQEKSMLSSLVKKISENAFRSHDDDFTVKLKQEMDKVLEINLKLRQENEKYKLTIDGLKLTIQSMKYEQEKLHSLLEKQGKQKKAALQQKGKVQSEFKAREEQVSKQHQKISQLNYTIHNNSRIYETDMNLKQNQNKALRLQIDKIMKQLRNLREVAYNYQVLTAENQNLKRKLMQVNSTIIHLWQVKETEYGNIYSLLADLKKQ